MKKIYTLALLFIITTFAASAQCTPDNTVTQPGYYPAELDTAKTGSLYNMVLQFRIPPDTNVVFGGFPVKATIDSIRLLEVAGLPTGFTYQCNGGKCTFVPTKTACALLSGTATSTQVGVYPLELRILAYARVSGFPVNQPDTIRNFTLIVAQGTGGPNSVIGYRGDNRQVAVYPNPASKNLAILLRGENNETVTYEITDVNGRVYRKENVVLENSEVLIGTTIEGLANGIYFVRVTNAKGVSAVRLMVE